MTRLTVDLSDSVDAALSQMAADNKTTKADIMRRAFALMSIAEREKKKGHHVAIVKDTEVGGKNKTEVVAVVAGI